MIVPSPQEFAAYVNAYDFEEPVLLDASVVAQARRVLTTSGLMLVGEHHGIRETPLVLYALALQLGARAVAFEWSWEEMDAPLHDFMETGVLSLERLWKLPAAAEFFSGDGRITAGHFALLARLRDDGLLDQVIAYDRLDPDPLPEDPYTRDRDMAHQLLERWNRDSPLIVLTGCYHAHPSPSAGETMASVIASAGVPVEPVMLQFESGKLWSRGAELDAAQPTPPAPMVLSFPRARPAAVPAHPDSVGGGTASLGPPRAR